MSLEIRKATEEDKQWVSNKLAEINWTTIESLDDVVVAIVDDMRVGMARAEFFDDKNIPTIAGVYVEDSQRGQKLTWNEKEGSLGLLMVEEVINNFPDVHKWYLAGHPWIVDYYQRVGFQQIQEVIAPLKRDHIKDQVFMELDTNNEY